MRFTADLRRIPARKGRANPNRKARSAAQTVARAAALAAVLLLAMAGSEQAARAQQRPDPRSNIDGLVSRFVNVDGVRARFYEYGQGEPMVMIHGGFTANSSTANVFARNIRGLAEHFHVFAIDRLASGMSGNPKNPADYGYQGDVDFVYHFIQTMKLGKVHLVGHSAGGAIAFYLALEHPEVVRTLTILAVGPENPPHGANKLVGLLKQCPNQSTYSGLRCRASMLAWLPNTFSEDYWRADEFMAELPKTKAARAALAARAQELRKAGEEMRDRMLERARTQGLNVPVLMVAGADDVLDWPADKPYADLAGQRALFHIIAEKDPRVQMIVIANGGHFMYREHPMEFNSYLTTFIHYWENNPAAPAQGGMPKPPKN